MKKLLPVVALFLLAGFMAGCSAESKYISCVEEKGMMKSKSCCDDAGLTYKECAKITVHDATK